METTPIPCKKCSSMFLMDTDYSAWCPECSNLRCRVFSRGESKNFLLKLAKRAKYSLFEKFRPFSFNTLIHNFNSYRDSLCYQDPFHFIILTRLIALVYEAASTGVILQGPQQGLIRKRLINERFLLPARDDVFMNEIHAIHCTKDRVRVVEYQDHPIYKSGTAIKYTENWYPILARMVILGIFPNDLKVSKIGMAMWQSYMNREIILERLRDKDLFTENIAYDLTWAQNLQCHFPDRRFPWRPLQTEHLPQQFYTFLQQLTTYKGTPVPLTDWIRLISQMKDPKMRDIIQGNTITLQELHKFPLFCQMGDNQIIYPATFLNQFLRVSGTIFGPRGGQFRQKYGEEFENYIFENIQGFSVSTSDVDGRSFLRYKNPKIHPSEEIFDVGCYHPKIKQLYVCELKAKVRLNFLMEEDLESVILKEIEKFRDVVIPRVRNSLDIIGISGYEVIPIYMNLVPPLNEDLNPIIFSKQNDLTLVSSTEGVGAVLEEAMANAHLSFDERYKIPQEFFDFAISPVVQKLLLHKGLPFVDGSEINPGFSPEQVLIQPVRFKAMNMNQDPPELDVKPVDPRYSVLIPSINIPPHLVDTVKDLQVREGEILNIITYRIMPHSWVMTLGNIAHSAVQHF